MMECPKCQFNQPKDQFCASCGIDMERYAQKHRTSTRSLKPALWGGAAALVLLLGFFVLAPVFNSPIFFGNSSDLSLEEERIESFGRFNLGEPRKVASSETQGLAASPQSAAAPEPLNPSDPEETQRPASPETTPEYRVIFALVPAELVAQWIQQASDFSSLEQVSSGALPGQTLSRAAGRYDSLLNFNFEDLEEGLPFVTSLDEIGVEAVGFTLEGEWEDGILSLEAVRMDVDRQEAENSETRWVEREALQRWTFDMKPGSPVFLVGLMPRPLPVRRSTPWNLPGLFELWDLEEFVVGQKELVLIIAPGR